MTKAGLEDINTVNRAGKSMSDNVDYISSSQNYFIYEYKLELKRYIESAEQILENSPDYMTENELEFLKNFRDAFSNAERHGGYNLENQTYLNLFRSLLEALDDRMNKERRQLAEDGSDEAVSIQHLFYLIDSSISEEFEKIESDWNSLLSGDTSILENADRVNWMIKQLVRTYKIEFDYLEGNGADRTLIERTKKRLRKGWKQTFEGTDIAVNA